MRRFALVVTSVALALAVSGCDMTGGSAALRPAGPGNGVAGGESGSAIAALDRLPVHGAAGMTGYSRSAYGPAWDDGVNVPDGHDHCDTRNDILIRDLTGITYRYGHCEVASGILHDPYTGKIIHFTRGVRTSLTVQIDHVVALGDAWQTGAQGLTQGQRTDLANDPLELLAVDGLANQAKGDADAADWLPPNQAFRCAYVARQVAVKAKYGLWVTAREELAMHRVLGSCPGERLPREPGALS
jgi:hypothetical protein